MKKNNVYIAVLKPVLPELYNPEIVADVVYSVEAASEFVNKLARKAIKSIGIKHRPFVRDLTKYPEKVLLKDEYHPLKWGKTIVSDFLNYVTINEIGHLSVSYNISSHKDFLPSLACQIVSEMNLLLDVPPEELTYLGCASALFSIKSAVEYCSEHDKASVVYNFDQCSWLCDPVIDRLDPEFTSSLKTNLLFSDGAMGILIIPESLKHKFNLPLIKIIDIHTDFKSGSEIKMNNGRFLVGDHVKSVMPSLVADMIIKPMLANYNLGINDIKEWSIHQGGKPILDMFTETEVLGLNQDQITRSKELFEEYGNFSSPSCLYVLDSFFKENSVNKNSETKGLVVGFGAGYYLASMLYDWE